ncbi:MAG: hypothetical protein KJP02_02000 [Octadecabacter sp.]|nr:hypothetical protein [Octadecabacter sp.]
MARTLMAAANAALLATSAGAGHITFSLPDLTFPPQDGASHQELSCKWRQSGACTPQG